jgi:hypothetical protein
MSKRKKAVKLAILDLAKRTIKSNALPYKYLASIGDAAFAEL